MIPYFVGVVLTVASSGSEDSVEADALVGEMRSRSGAKLKYTINDVNALQECMPTYGSYCESELVSFQLIDPTTEELTSTIKKIANFLKEAKCEKGRKKIFNIIYAGHGNSLDGGWELCNGTITGQELHEQICAVYEPCEDKLHIDLILDSCYSSRFLIDFMVTAQNNETVYPFDCVASSLPDEVSWEMEFLEHGAMSFHLTNDGNSYVDPNELAKAVDNKDLRTVIRALQGMTVPNPVSFLTNGLQHAVELTSGHYLEVQGSGHIELGPYIGNLTHVGIANALRLAKTAYGKCVEYEI